MDSLFLTVAHACFFGLELELISFDSYCKSILFRALRIFVLLGKRGGEVVCGGGRGGLENFAWN